MKQDVLGLRFGRLVITNNDAEPGAHYRRVEATCDCGQIAVVRLAHLRSGDTKSCGCLQAQAAAARQYKHGHARATEYNSWRRMKVRCYNPKVPEWPRYGGRGIYVCDRWLTGDGERSGFECFLSDMGSSPGPQYSLERIANHLSYYPKNCVWATQTEQCRNTRRNRMIPFGVGLVPLVVATEVLGLSYSKVKNRLRYGWSVERALTE